MGADILSRVLSLPGKPYENLEVVPRIYWA
jgi:hypothetical protein